MNRPLAFVGCTLALALGAAGCGNPFDDDDFVTVRATDAQLREIDALRLEDRSRSEPESIETAAATIGDRIAAEIAATVEPPASLTVTVEEVRASAIAHNLDLVVELVNPLIAAATVDAEEAKFESVFTASYQRSKTDSPTAVATEGSQVDFESFDVGLEIPLRTGGTATISAPFNETSTNNPFATLDPSYDTSVRFSLSQPLLRNAGNRANTYSIRVAKYDAQATESLTKLETLRVLAAADRAFWNLYAARRELEVRQRQHELARAQLDRARRRFDAGDVAEIEVIRAESGVAEQIEAIITADTSVRRRERDLKRIMNRPDVAMGGPTVLVPGTDPDPVGLDLDAAALADLAVENRMEMLELELRLAIDASTIDLRRNEKLPLVTLDYTYSFNGLGSTYDNAWGQIADRSFSDWFLSVRAEFPIGNEVATARLQEAVLRRVQRLATRDQRRQSIRQEVFDAVDQMRQSWQRILAARQGSILAGRTLEAEQRQFDVGASTSTDVLDATTRLADAQSAEVRALSDYQIAQIDLAFATGTLLGYEKVRWDAQP